MNLHRWWCSKINLLNSPVTPLVQSPPSSLDWRFSTGQAGERGGKGREIYQDHVGNLFKLHTIANTLACTGNHFKYLTLIWSSQQLMRLVTDTTPTLQIKRRGARPHTNDYSVWDTPQLARSCNWGWLPWGHCWGRDGHRSFSVSRQRHSGEPLPRLISVNGWTKSAVICWAGTWHTKKDKHPLQHPPDVDVWPLLEHHPWRGPHRQPSEGITSLPIAFLPSRSSFASGGSDISLLWPKGSIHLIPTLPSSNLNMGFSNCSPNDLAQVPHHPHWFPQGVVRLKKHPLRELPALPALLGSQSFHPCSLIDSSYVFPHRFPIWKIPKRIKKKKKIVPYISVYVCVCVCVCVCVYMYMCICGYICRYTYTYIHIYIYTRVYMYIGVYMYVFTHLYTHLYTQLYMHVHMYICTRVYICIRVYRCVCMYICLYTCIHIYISTYVYSHIYVYIHIYTQTCVYI